MRVRILVGEATADRLHLGAGIVDGDAIGQASEDYESGALAALEVRRLVTQREPQEIPPWEVEVLGHDPHDLVRLGSEVDGRSEHVGIASQVRLPELVGDDRDVSGTG
jgi:hypothetical protein